MAIHIRMIWTISNRIMLEPNALKSSLECMGGVERLTWDELLKKWCCSKHFLPVTCLTEPSSIHSTHQSHTNDTNSWFWHCWWRKSQRFSFSHLLIHCLRDDHKTGACISLLADVSRWCLKWSWWMWYTRLMNVKDEMNDWKVSQCSTNTSELFDTPGIIPHPSRPRFRIMWSTFLVFGTDALHALRKSRFSIIPQTLNSTSTTSHNSSICLQRRELLVQPRKMSHSAHKSEKVNLSLVSPESLHHSTIHSFTLPIFRKTVADFADNIWQ